ncbi:nucleoside-binding protein [Oscillibacter sp. PC13]|uniref:BMP family protein n=1 Tax=Oscillibacter sp. PC13 TaxID=1855299 RepID=UPI0008EA6DCD|nr:BMP family protein [Oscillibacter sp. PC13]SFQ10238.1 nucleoside-binding protein [Oscillibacter sp. PC13]
MKKVYALFLALTLTAALLSGCGGTGTTTPPAGDSGDKEAPEESAGKIQNVAMLLPGLISDQSWNYSAYLGLQEIEEMGYHVEYTESVEQNDSETVFRTYASGDFDLIMGHGYSFIDASLAVAPAFPEKYFYVYGTAPTDVAEEDLPANTAYSYNKEYEGAYVCGVVAAMESESNKIGIVGGAPSNAQIANYNAFREGAQSVKPEIDVSIIVTGTFDDPAKGKEAAYSLIEGGCDVVMHVCDATGTGVIDACVERNVKVLGYGGDQRDLAPDQMLCCLGVNISQCIADQIEKIENGTFSGVQRDGLAEGAIYITEFGTACAEETATKAQEVIQGIVDGSIVPTEVSTEY